MTIYGLPLDFAIFAMTLLGVALFHHHALLVAIIGLLAASLLHILGGPSLLSDNAHELGIHFIGEWVILSNLLLLLLGFAVVANHFEDSNLPDLVPSRLPSGAPGGVVLLGLVFCLSTFLDNIAAAIVGGVLARRVYAGEVTIGFQAAIVSAANAGGAGSVIGDTTTTMMWISGVGAVELLPAFIGGLVSFAVFAPIAATAQHKHSPILPRSKPDDRVDWTRAGVVLFALATIVVANVVANTFLPDHEDLVPVLGLSLWAAILSSAPVRAPKWRILPEALKGATFLVTLVALASLMPVDRLPEASPTTTLGLGFLSAVFDNIPLTALAINQGGYDWALLAYAVGFGGSMVWFGSSAGVALTNLLPEGRSVIKWLRFGWFVPIAYVLGFIAQVTVVTLFGG